METIKLTDNRPITAETADKWPTLMENLYDVMADKYKGLTTDIFAEQRRGRSADDQGDITYIKTAENRLSSLCKNIANQIEESTVNNEEYSLHEIFTSMRDCFDLDHAYNLKTSGLMP